MRKRGGFSSLDSLGTIWFRCLIPSMWLLCSRMCTYVHFELPMQDHIWPSWDHNHDCYLYLHHFHHHVWGSALLEMHWPQHWRFIWISESNVSNMASWTPGWMTYSIPHLQVDTCDISDQVMLHKSWLPGIVCTQIIWPSPQGTSRDAMNPTSQSQYHVW